MIGKLIWRTKDYAIQRVHLKADVARGYAERKSRRKPLGYNLDRGYFKIWKKHPDGSMEVVDRAMSTEAARRRITQLRLHDNG